MEVKMLDRLFGRKAELPEQPDVITLRQAAALLGMSREGVRKLIKQDMIRGENRQGRWIADRASVIAYNERRPAAIRERAQSRRLWAKAQRQKLAAKKRAQWGAARAEPLRDADGNRVRVVFDDDGNVVRR
jgi:hypothetical protein